MTNDPTPTNQDAAAIAAEALPAAIAAYTRAVRAVRAARADFASTLAAAGDATPDSAFSGAVLEDLFGAMNVINNEAERLTVSATTVGSAVVKAGLMLEHDVNVHLARGQAREMLGCECGKCGTCATRAEALTAGRDPLAELAARILAELEPSGLVAPDGAPLGGPPPNRHDRRAARARGRA